MTFLRCAAIFTLLASSTLASAAEHTVMMKNNGADGMMVFEPGLLNVEVGDTVTFEPTDTGHNSESIKGMRPEGSVSWQGMIHKSVSVTIDTEGVYVYRCLPHTSMGMVGVIVAGEATNLDSVKEKAAELSSHFMMNQDRLGKYLAQIKPANTSQNGD